MLMFFFGCFSFGPSKPNIPFSGDRYTPILKNLYENKPLLVEELGKLPEIKKKYSVNGNYVLA
jgi:hypothetical protein